MYVYPNEGYTIHMFIVYTVDGTSKKLDKNAIIVLRKNSKIYSQVKKYINFRSAQWGTLLYCSSKMTTVYCLLYTGVLEMVKQLMLRNQAILVCKLDPEMEPD